MKRILSTLLAAWIYACCTAAPGGDMRIAVVPRPTSVIEAPGTFRLTARTPIVICDEQLRRPAEIFVDAIAALTGFVPTITTVNAPAAIVLHLTPGY